MSYQFIPPYMPRASQTPKEPVTSPTPQSFQEGRTISRIPLPSKQVKQFAVFLVLSLLVLTVLISIWGGVARQSTLSIPSGASVTAGMGRMDAYSAPIAVSGKVITSQYYDRSGGAPGYEIILPPVPPEPGTDASTPTIPTERKVIKNGSLTLLVSNVEQTAQMISNIALSLGGFVEGTSFNEYVRGMRTGYMTIRVPGEQFDTVMASLKGLAVRVENESSNAQDVSAQYVDLEASLKNYRAEEAQYQEIMSRAQKIEDVLNVASRLADVRGRIERTQGQLNLLSRQVAMSTITVTLTPEASAKTETNAWRPWTIAKEAFQGVVARLIAFANALIAFIVYLPLILLRLAFYALIVWGLWRLAKWGYTKFTGKPLPPLGGGV